MILAAWAQSFLCWPIIDRGFVEPKIVALFAAVVWASTRRLSRRLARPVLACYGALLISWWFSVSTQLSLYGLPVQCSYGLMAIACYSVVFSYSHILPVKPQSWRWLAFALGAISIIQHLGMDPLLHARAAHGLPFIAGRSVGWMGSPVDLGATLAMLIQFCGGIIIMFPVALGLLFTCSRGAWIAAACGLLVRRWPRLTYPILICSCLVVFLPARNKDDAARVAIWHGGWQAFMARPAIGLGPSTAALTFVGEPKAQYDAVIGPGRHVAAYHNDIIEALAGTGLLGLLCYLWLLGSLRWTPAMVAIFVNMKVNPLGVDVMTIAAIIAGSAQ